MTRSHRYWGFFVQDDWRVGSRMTVNLGLRYEYETPLTEKDNKSVRGFDATAVQAIEAAARARYALNPTPEVPVSSFNVRGGLTFAGVDGQPRGLYETPEDQLHAAGRHGVQARRARPCCAAATVCSTASSASAAATSSRAASARTRTSSRRSTTG